MKKKIIRLTESELVKLVKRVLKEQDFNMEEVLNNPSDWNEGMVLIQNKDADTVSRVLNNLPSNLKFLSILNSEYADFSDIDLCQFENFIFLNLNGTPHNLEENVNCHYENLEKEMYDFHTSKKK